jgi:carbamoyltransferase
MVFDTPSRDLTEFMLRTLKIRPEWQRKISAVCHIDMTTRPQCLEKEQNPELYSLLMAFYRATGIPCLINTSFNGKNEPIIETPEQAIAFLKRTLHMNRVVFNSKWVVRNDL